MIPKLRKTLVQAYRFTVLRSAHFVHLQPQLKLSNTPRHKLSWTAYVAKLCIPDSALNRVKTVVVAICSTI